MNARKPRSTPSTGSKNDFFDVNLDPKYFDYSPSSIQVIHCKRLNLNEWSDEKVVMDYYKSGDTRIIGELYQRYSVLVMGTCIKYLRNEVLAQDATTEIFIKLMAQLKKTRPLTFKVWLYVVTKNYCLELLRTEARSPTIERSGTEVTNFPSTDSNTLDDGATQKDKWMSQVGIALKKLPVKQRESIELFFFEGLRYREIAFQTGWTQNEVKSYIQNGKRNLKIFLSAQKSSLGCG